MMNWKRLFRRPPPPSAVKESRKAENISISTDKDTVRVLEYGSASHLTRGQGGSASEQHQHKNVP